MSLSPTQTSAHSKIRVALNRQILNNSKFRAWLFQIAVVSVLAAVLGALASIAAGNLARQGIATGYDFLARTARFEISETLIPYSGADSYARALAVGLLNTLKVAALAIVFATVLGTVVGIARISNNRLLALVAGMYVEGLRNIPLLLQLSFWYSMLTISFPPPRAAIDWVGGIFLSNRGIVVPSLSFGPYGYWIAVSICLAFLVSVATGRRASTMQERTGHRPIVWPYSLSIVVFPIITWLALGMPFEFELPVLHGFNFAGGLRLTPEFGALLFGLSAYSSAFIAETIRGGILAITKGQVEAGRSLGLHNGRIMRLIVLPQALRIIIPPLTSQYLNLIKNSSLGVAIAYPDIVAIGNITINQTGQAIEVVSIFMAVYLSINLVTAGFMNWYNYKMALVTR
ncbi:amino acid ABC transporter permease [Rhizobium sp. BK176]|uniref:amino acid ABC transporter permease n=1 Tax=Rhizobium sp. BK176 TaxID=2587071 RepID=UPI00216A29F3|nr:ABC transporter permease subunit [Rhizobium sp. BK176]MCS4093721.1 general L-amino acid transport system permease protein [Rhizobium sp. BK176]